MTMTSIQAIALGLTHDLCSTLSGSDMDAAEISLHGLMVTVSRACDGLFTQLGLQSYELLKDLVDETFVRTVQSLGARSGFDISQDFIGTRFADWYDMDINSLFSSDI